MVATHRRRRRLTSTTTLGSWPETKGNATRAIHAYTSAPTVELLVNGKSVGDEKYDYKLRWLAALRDYLVDTLAEYDDVAVVGDGRLRLGLAR